MNHIELNGLLRYVRVHVNAIIAIDIREELRTIEAVRF